MKNEENKIVNIFKAPKIIGVVADANFGKSNLLYHFLLTLQKKHKFNLWTYGLKNNIGDKKFYSIEELEQVKDSIIFVDEFFSLFDLEDRKKRVLIEKTIRLIYHNNNVLLLCGLPENFKKFISNKLNTTIYGKCTIGDFINGSKIKYNCVGYKGVELGSSVLNLPKNKFLIFDKNYYQINVPYIQKFDTKLKNSEILRSKVEVVKKLKECGKSGANRNPKVFKKE